jgi:hypothetical protein
MRKFLIILAVVGFVFMGCDNGTTSGGGGEGTLTLKDIPAKYNGKYVDFRVDDFNEAIIRGGERKQPEGFMMPVFFNVKISNGKAVIPLYNMWHYPVEPYTWDDTFFYNDPSDYGQSQRIAAFIWEKDWVQYSWESTRLDAVSFPTITFTNGSAIKSWNDGLDGSKSWYNDDDRNFFDRFSDIANGGIEWRNKIPTKLVGTWKYNGQELFAIGASGTGSIEGQDGYRVQVRSKPMEVKFTQGSTETGIFEFDFNGSGSMRIMSGTGPFSKWANIGKGGFNWVIERW